MSFTHIHRKNGLEEKLPEEEGTKSQRGPAKGAAGAPPAGEGEEVVAAGERTGSGEKRNCPSEQPYPNPKRSRRHAGRIIQKKFTRII
jgi:hypothetical protein